MINQFLVNEYNLEKHKAEVTNLSFSECNTMLVSSCLDKTVIVWDLKTKEAIIEHV